MKGNEPITPLTIFQYRTDGTPKMHTDGTPHMAVNELGLTKREYFASLAMQSLIALQRTTDKGIVEQVWWIGTESDRADLCKKAVELADDLINQLNATEK